VLKNQRGNDRGSGTPLKNPKREKNLQESVTQICYADVRKFRFLENTIQLILTAVYGSVLARRRPKLKFLIAGTLP
jgi:hypothetical protein